MLPPLIEPPPTVVAVDVGFTVAVPDALAKWNKLPPKPVELTRAVALVVASKSTAPLFWASTTPLLPRNDLAVATDLPSTETPVMSARMPMLSMFEVGTTVEFAVADTLRPDAALVVTCVWAVSEAGPTYDCTTLLSSASMVTPPPPPIATLVDSKLTTGFAVPVALSESASPVNVAPSSMKALVCMFVFDLTSYRPISMRPAETPFT